jgi:glycosyltransferase involved in cell wall biosynthesis
MRDLVIVPIYNEAASVAKVLCEVRHFAVGADIICIDDGSTDETRRILAAEPEISIIRHGTNEGYGRSLIDGFGFAQAGGYARMVTIDCDEQHEPRLIPSFLEALTEEGADVVSASRYFPDQENGNEPPADRRRINETITRRIDSLTGWNLTDAFCGFKAYRVAAVAKLPLSEPGYGMPLEFWIRAAAAGLAVVERPVPRIYCDSDRSFGADLDYPDRRLAYYQRVIDSAVGVEDGEGSR